MLLKQIEQIHAESQGTYGWPRVHAELALGLGWTVNRKRSCAKRASRASNGADAGAARSVTPPGSPARTWSTGSSASRGGSVVAHRYHRASHGGR